MATSRIAKLAALQALMLQFLDAEGAQEMLNGIKTLINAKANPSDITEAITVALTPYAKSTDVATQISEAVAASEKKIFGDGELAEAFDTIQEIGAYLKDHDSVATAIYEAIGKKADQTEVNGIKNDIADIKAELGMEGGSSGSEGLSSRVEKAEEEISSLKTSKLDASTYNTEKANFATKDDIAEFLTEEDLEEIVQPIPTDTIKSWFA